jgi:riboflavin kinase/FMN adenylyltransferase
MKVHYSLDQLPDFRQAVLTIGSFDGVHRGHQELLTRVRHTAQAVGGESVVITFHPHPRLVVYPGDTELRILTTIEEKIERIGRHGVDHLVIVPFTIEFSQLSADEYIERFLIDRFHPHTIVIGYDHRFGLNRQGDINYLKHYAARAGFHVAEIEPQLIDDIAVSSTKIRRALEAGQVADANRQLGHPYLLTGKVVHGRQLGRTIGFPTANIDIDNQHKLIPPDGVYAVRVYLGDSQQRFDGMLYIGTRPTLADGDERSIEVNIFDFNESIYGEWIRLELIDFVRGDESFPDLKSMQAQLGKDRERTLEVLQTLAESERRARRLRTAIVILNYNGREHLERFLPEVIASLPAAETTELIVADNGSTDDSLSWLAATHPGVRILDLADNFGFAEGYNRALRQVEADVYVLLNSDVAVTPDWLHTPLSVLERHRDVAAVQPKIRSYRDQDYFEYAGAAGGFIDQLGYPFCRGRIFANTERDTGQYDDRTEIFWASGAALFIRAELFHRVGGFDGAYFAHAEEIDLCWRLKRAGYRILALPESEVYHVGGGTLSYDTPYKTYLNFRNTLITGLKNEPFGKVFWWLPVRLALDFVAGLLFLSQGKFRHILSIVRAHWHFLPRLRRHWRLRLEMNRRVEAVRIGADRTAFGRLNGSIIVHYFLLGNRRFSDLAQYQSDHDETSYGNL